MVKDVGAGAGHAGGSFAATGTGVGGVEVGTVDSAADLVCRI